MGRAGRAGRAGAQRRVSELPEPASGLIYPVGTSRRRRPGPPARARRHRPVSVPLLVLCCWLASNCDEYIAYYFNRGDAGERGKTFSSSVLVSASNWAQTSGEALQNNVQTEKTPWSRRWGLFSGVLQKQRPAACAGEITLRWPCSARRTRKQLHRFGCRRCRRSADPCHGR